MDCAPPRRDNGCWLLYDTHDGSLFRCSSDWQPYVRRGQFSTIPVDVVPPSPAPELAIAGLRLNSLVGRRVVLVGNGPAAKEFKAPPGYITVSVNFPRHGAAFVVAGDFGFLEAVDDGLYGAETKADMIDSTVILCSNERCKVEWIHRVGRSRAWSTQIEEVFGIDSGMMALNLVLNLNPHSVYLVGFSMAPGKATAHVFPGGDDVKVYDRFFTAWQREAPRFRDRVTVVGPSRLASILPHAERLPEFELKPMVHVDGMSGLGDQVWQRPHLTSLAQNADVFLATPWPQLWQGTGVHPVASTRDPHLRTQADNSARSTYEAVPDGKVQRVRLGYTPGRPVYEQLAEVLPLSGKYDLSLTVPDEWVDQAKKIIGKKKRKPLCIVRQPILRKEWMNSSRNPDPAAFRAVVDLLREKYTLVSIANLKEGEEWIVDPVACDLEFHAGEFSIEALIGAHVLAGLAVGPNGNLLPLALATKTRALIVWGGSEDPEFLVHPGVDLAGITICQPEVICTCGKRDHACVKAITEQEIQRAVTEFCSR